MLTFLLNIDILGARCGLAMAGQQCPEQGITLRGSANIVAEFFSLAINSILYQRGVYRRRPSLGCRNADSPCLSRPTPSW